MASIGVEFESMCGHDSPGRFQLDFYFCPVRMLCPYFGANHINRYLPHLCHDAPSLFYSQLTQSVNVKLRDFFVLKLAEDGNDHCLLMQS